MLMAGDRQMNERRKSLETQDKLLDRGWHLARTPLEIDVTEVEYALMRSYEAFGHWQAECLATVIEFSASGMACTHTVPMIVDRIGMPQA